MNDFLIILLREERRERERESSIKHSKKLERRKRENRRFFSEFLCPNIFVGREQEERERERERVERVVKSDGVAWRSVECVGGDTKAQLRRVRRLLEFQKDRRIRQTSQT